MPDKTNNQNAWSALGLAWGLGFQIAIPLVIFALGGRLLDRQFNTSPWMLLIGVTTAAILSSYLVFKRINQLLKEIDQVDKSNNSDQNKNNKKLIDTKTKE